MEKRTASDIRRENFTKQGKIAHDLADLAIQEIDEVLEERFVNSKINYEHVLGRAVLRGEIDATEMTKALSDYEAWLNGENNEQAPGSLG